MNRSIRLFAAIVLAVVSGAGFAQQRVERGGRPPARAEIRDSRQQAAGRFEAAPPSRFQQQQPFRQASAVSAYPGMRPAAPAPQTAAPGYARPSVAGEPASSYRGYGGGEAQSVMPGETIGRSQSQSAADRAQQMNGGGRVLAVQSDPSGYRVKLLKNGEVHAVYVPN